MITVTKQSLFPGNGIAPDLMSIGWGLARTARFAGQTLIWYPVLPHVYSVTDLVSEEFKIEALLHDAPEAILGDRVSTWKTDAMETQEKLLLDSIYESLGLNIIAEMSEEVRNADLACRAAEATLLGHAEADHPHFADIRKDLPELYERAIEVTRDRIAIYTSEFCINETEKRALDYSGHVIRELTKVRNV